MLYYLLYLLLGLALLGNFVILFIVQDNSPVLKFLIRRRCYFIYHVIVSFYLLPLGEYGKQLLEKSFMNFCNSIGEPLMFALSKYKKKLFAGLQESGDHGDETEVSRPALTILEIGIGYGVNFQYYPKECDLIALEPARVYKKIIENKLKFKEFQGIHLKQYLEIGAENMSQIPDGSVDVVIGTLLLCSVKHPELVLKEILRVLKPGGKYYFYEHVLAKQHTLLNIWQQLFNLTHVWEHCMEGCKFNNIKPLIKRLGFDDVKGTEVQLQYDDFYLPLMFIKPNYYGIATK